MTGAPSRAGLGGLVGAAAQKVQIAAARPGHISVTAPNSFINCAWATGENSRLSMFACRIASLSSDRTPTASLSVSRRGATALAQRPAAPAHNCCISAGIDLALALLEQDHGRNLALEVARYLVLFLERSGGQAQFSTQLRAQFSAIPAIRKSSCGVRRILRPICASARWRSAPR